MSKQISLLPYVMEQEDIDELKRQTDLFLEYANKKRRWEYAFQKWSNKGGIDGRLSFGSCGYGSMCDWCEDNSYGRPCVRALNSMCREKGILIDYTKCNSEYFEEVWDMLML